MVVKMDKLKRIRCSKNECDDSIWVYPETKEKLCYNCSKQTKEE